ncbi:hypothetical protein [Phenylobacterium sp.]|uniref:hypothetical protein n=1 Tax=Phenylobacterium sp. TaxID=1871053 RepID=UPI003BAC6174
MNEGATVSMPIETPARRLGKRVLQDARALEDLRQAFTYLISADQLWDLLGNAPPRHAIYKAAVVTYSRPFIAARSPSGGRTQAYPIREHLGTEGFEREVHAHLLDLRNLFLAHVDPVAYPSRLATVTFKFDFDTGETSSGEVGLATCVYSWDGLDDRGYLHRVLAHIDAFSRSIQLRLQERLRELQTIASLDRTAIGEFAEVQRSSATRIESGEEARYSMSDLLGMTWKKPDAEIGGPEYHYRASNVFATSEAVTPGSDGQLRVNAGPASLHLDRQG